MAKYHYLVETKHKVELKENGNKTAASFDDVLAVKENKKLIYESGDFRLVEKDESFSGKIETILFYIAITAVLLLLIILGLYRDYGNGLSAAVDDLIGIVAILFAIVSIPPIKRFIGKKISKYGYFFKIWMILMLLLIPFGLLLIMKRLGIPQGISNTLGLIGILLSILFW